jgi:enterochelin esterase-like enzyme
MTVYTPPNYNSHRGYPVLYLMHGAGGNDTDWVANMRANFILDNLIAQHKVKPMVVVMPDTNVGSTGGLNGSVTADQFIQQELLGTIVPYIEHNYRTLPGARNRALAGLSMGQLPYAERPVHEPDRLQLLRPVQQRSPVPRHDH